ncbi:MAG: PQQ-binding-like beta-propeller repeat protein, partial [Steroidobacteraceae bacterium]
MKNRNLIGVCVCLLALAACGSPRESTDSQAAQWLANGRDVGKTFYSPLEGIRRDNVSRLGFAWEFQTGTARGMESTPLVVDGVMYVSGVAGRVYALDPTTGKALWNFEPPVDLKYSRSACCDIVNRGLAVLNGRVYVAAVDGILYSLNATDGRVLWKTDTVVDRTRAYSITGAPQIAGGVVVIGNGGAEYDSRGYVSAYDIQSGVLAWRFFTVPGDPSKPQESPALEKAVKTWHGGNWWERGGGGNVWDAITYDPETGLVYFGTANGAPTSLSKRSPG